MPPQKIDRSQAISHYTPQNLTVAERLTFVALVWILTLQVLTLRRAVQRKVFCTFAGPVSDLMPTRKPARDGFTVVCSHRRKEALLTDLHRHVIMTITEAARHPAAPRIDFGDVFGRPAQNGFGAARSLNRALLAVTVKHHPDAVFVKCLRRVRARPPVHSLAKNWSIILTFLATASVFSPGTRSR